MCILKILEPIHNVLLKILPIKCISIIKTINDKISPFISFIFGIDI